jgi:hypothetical protein
MLSSYNNHYDLNIMKEGQTLSDITSRAMTKLEDVIKKERPDTISGLSFFITSSSFVIALEVMSESV